ncbi:electron transfer flavoprotein subunit alpha/FixB family protein [[Enterobacter] lignolyticus]|uniref:Electron transfer flavoprotein alpha subunit C-terminal domain-containing protein n=1 Tax=[Enterobacter] lignolyticus TaxID=1334193 RepID=A0A806X7K0_9ENTR|nr:electron transfer flavoprotein subunit alpha/FixB family protein [[Enterobacter] lignolyticus]ALR77884.1 hypothetical protein AO703_16845 [[Enterobacter] lignolyticus]
MKIALVMHIPGEGSALMSFLEHSGLTAAERVCWQLEGDSELPEQWLAPLEDAFHRTPVDLILFAGGGDGDELATRLAWRLQGCGVCQVRAFDAGKGTVNRAVYGNALTAELAVDRTPLCLSLASVYAGNTPQGQIPQAEALLYPAPLRDGLSLPVQQNAAQNPLLSASRVLACGQGAYGVDTGRLAQALGAEPGFSRQRVMSGGCDEQRMLGISGHRVAPSLCFVVGASGASAFMAGVEASRYIVAINQDPDAPVFAAADIGVVGDAAQVLEALADCYHQASVK